MKLPVHFILTCCLSPLLSACDSILETEQSSTATVEPTIIATTPAIVVENGSTPMPATGNHEIELSFGKVSIRANQVNELELLNELATLANFRLLAGDIDWQEVTVDIQTESLQAALVEVLKGYPYQIVYAPDEDNRQEILTEVVIGDLPAAAAPNHEETDAANKELLKDIEELSEDGQQMAYTQQLQNPQAEIRVAAAKKVKPVGDAFPMLTDMLQKDPSPEVRIATTWALEMSEDPLAIEALVKCLQDENPTVVVECIKSLDFLGDETTVQYLIPMLTHSDEDVRSAAADAIKSLQ